MEIFINGLGSISPQNTFQQDTFLAELREHENSRLNNIEPDYKNLIDPKMIRRMSRVIKLGMVAGLESLKQAAIEKPDAIITGTAYGCAEDTENFLGKMISQNEEMLTPTAFIQSTHNTIAAQIALSLQCNGYNNNYVQRGFSFEHALLDALLFLKDEEEVKNVMVGGIDEISNTIHTLLGRLGQLKRQPTANTELYSKTSKGTIAGEGSSFFILSKTKQESTLAKIDSVETIFDKDGKLISGLLKNIAAADLIISGHNGDENTDASYDKIIAQLPFEAPVIRYKHLCGEYPTASAFALYIAANIAKRQEIPFLFPIKGNITKPINKILIYNQPNPGYHAFIQVSIA